MGAFGTSSHANDTSWDVLGHLLPDNDSHRGFPMTQSETDATVAYILSGFDDGDRGLSAHFTNGDESETILGPVVWLLEEGFTIPLILLERALTIARARRLSEPYLACWTDPEERRNVLAEEIVQLRAAIKVSSS